MEGTIGEIRMFAGNFSPRSWLFCSGQLINIASNTALFSILGTTYGGNGQTTFAIPDFRGRVAVGTGQGAGLSNVILGERAGSPSVTLLAQNMPAHTHPLTGAVNMQINNDTAGLTDDATGRRFGAFGTVFTSVNGDLVNMAADVSTLAVGASGSSQPFGIMPPYLGMNYIICQFGIFPSRD